MFDKIIKQIRSELHKDLPGRDAHLKMASSLKDYSHLFDHGEAKRKKSGVLILLYPQDRDIYSVLIQRPEYPGYHSGQIGLPGGMVEPEDINIEDTALRETYEEIGIPKNQIIILGQLSMFYIPVSNIEAYPLVGYCNYKPHFILDPVEVVAIIKYPIKKLLNSNFISHKVMEFHGITIEVPYYDIDGSHVWGATGMMLSEFSEVLRRSGINL